MAGLQSVINGRKGGMPKGTKWKKTIDKEASLERIKQRVFAMSDKLIDAHTVVALGYHKMVIPSVDKNGNPFMTKVNEPAEIEKLLDFGVLGKDYFLVTGAEPDHKAITALMDRAYGKPTESIEHSGRDGKPMIIRLDT